MLTFWKKQIEMLTHEDIIKKTITLEDALALFTPEFRRTHSLVFTNGCFDLLHKGHIHLLKRAKKLGDLLVVGLNSDESVSKLKGSQRPVMSQQTRAEKMGALEEVDYIIIFQEETPMELIKALEPDILVKGGDYKIEEIVGHREVAEKGGRVETIPLLEGYSTTSIIDRSS